MRITEIAVSCERRLSDSNYGGECSQVRLTATLEGAEDPMAAIEVLFMSARTRLDADLRTSDSAAIRSQVASKATKVPIQATDTVWPQS